MNLGGTQTFRQDTTDWVSQDTADWVSQTITLGIRISTYECGGNTDIQTIANVHGHTALTVITTLKS